MSLARLRSGEWLATLGAVVLLASLFAVDWYGSHGRTGWWSYPPLRPRRVYTYPAHHGLALLVPARSGWDAIPTLRWFVLVSALLGLALTLAQAALRGPAPAVTLDLITMLVGGATAIAVLVRLASTGAPLRVGAVLGMLGIVAVAAGAYQALRAEQGWTPDGERAVEIVALGPPDGGG